MEWTEKDLRRILVKVQAEDSEWSDGQVLELGGGVRWQPHLVRPNAVMHVHLADRIRPYLRDRFAGCKNIGRHVVVALPHEQLWNEETLRSLVDADASILPIRIDSDDVRIGKANRILSAIADNGLRLNPALRKAIAATVWSRCKSEGSAHARGQYLEDLLVLLLSQIDDFRVVEKKLRTETEEIDVVVQTQGVAMRRCWSALAAPFVLVEAKNWSTKVGQAEISTFRTKMQGKRGTTRLGIIFGTNGFTQDAVNQELRFASGDLTIALVDGAHLEEWISADDCTEYLEECIRRAMLR